MNINLKKKFKQKYLSEKLFKLFLYLIFLNKINIIFTLIFKTLFIYFQHNFAI